MIVETISGFHFCSHLSFILFHKYPKLITTWKKRLFELMDNQSPWWNYGAPEYGAVNILSKFYCLTDNHNKTVDDLYPDGFKP